MSSNLYNIFNFLFRCFINSFTNKAVLNIIAQAPGFTKLIFIGWKTRNPMSSPIPEHENSRFWLFRVKFVIVEAVLISHFLSYVMNKLCCKYCPVFRISCIKCSYKSYPKSKALSIFMQNNQTSSMLMHIIRGRKLKGHIAFGRQWNRLPRRNTERSLAESFPAECWSWTAELSNGRLPFSRIFIFADLEKSNQLLFDSLFFRCNDDSATLCYCTEIQFAKSMKVRIIRKSLFVWLFSE